MMEEGIRIKQEKFHSDGEEDFMNQEVRANQDTSSRFEQYVTGYSTRYRGSLSNLNEETEEERGISGEQEVSDLDSDDDRLVIDERPWKSENTSEICEPTSINQTNKDDTNVMIHGSGIMEKTAHITIKEEPRDEGYCGQSLFDDRKSPTPLEFASRSSCEETMGHIRRNELPESRSNVVVPCGNCSEGKSETKSKTLPDRLVIAERQCKSENTLEIDGPTFINQTNKDDTNVMICRSGITERTAHITIKEEPRDECYSGESLFDDRKSPKLFASRSPRHQRVDQTTKNELQVSRSNVMVPCGNFSERSEPELKTLADFLALPDPELDLEQTPDFIIEETFSWGIEDFDFDGAMQSPSPESGLENGQEMVREHGHREIFQSEMQSSSPALLGSDNSNTGTCTDIHVRINDGTDAFNFQTQLVSPILPSTNDQCDKTDDEERRDNCNLGNSLLQTQPLSLNSEDGYSHIKEEPEENINDTPNCPSYSQRFSPITEKEYCQEGEQERCVEENNILLETVHVLAMPEGDHSDIIEESMGQTNDVPNCPPYTQRFSPMSDEEYCQEGEKERYINKEDKLLPKTQPLSAMSEGENCDIIEESDAHTNDATQRFSPVSDEEYCQEGEKEGCVDKEDNSHTYTLQLSHISDDNQGGQGNQGEHIADTDANSVNKEVHSANVDTHWKSKTTASNALAVAAQIVQRTPKKRDFFANAMDGGRRKSISTPDVAMLEDVSQRPEQIAHKDIDQHVHIMGDNIRLSNQQTFGNVSPKSPHSLEVPRSLDEKSSEFICDSHSKNTIDIKSSKYKMSFLDLQVPTEASEGEASMVSLDEDGDRSDRTSPSSEEESDSNDNECKSYEDDTSEMNSDDNETTEVHVTARTERPDENVSTPDVAMLEDASQRAEERGLEHMDHQSMDVSLKLPNQQKPGNVSPKSIPKLEAPKNINENSPELLCDSLSKSINDIESSKCKTRRLDLQVITETSEVEANKVSLDEDGDRSDRTSSSEEEESDSNDNECESYEDDTSEMNYDDNETKVHVAASTERPDENVSTPDVAMLEDASQRAEERGLKHMDHQSMDVSLKLPIQQKPGNVSPKSSPKLEVPKNINESSPELLCEGLSKNTNDIESSTETSKGGAREVRLDEDSEGDDKDGSSEEESDYDDNESEGNEDDTSEITSDNNETSKVQVAASTERPNENEIVDEDLEDMDNGSDDNQGDGTEDETKVTCFDCDDEVHVTPSRDGAVEDGDADESLEEENDSDGNEREANDENKDEMDIDSEGDKSQDEFTQRPQQCFGDLDVFAGIAPSTEDEEVSHGKGRERKREGTGGNENIPFHAFKLLKMKNSLDVNFNKIQQETCSDDNERKVLEDKNKINLHCSDEASYAAPNRDIPDEDHKGFEEDNDSDVNQRGVDEVGKNGTNFDQASSTHMPDEDRDDTDGIEDKDNNSDCKKRGGNEDAKNEMQFDYDDNAQDSLTQRLQKCVGGLDVFPGFAPPTEGAKENEGKRDEIKEPFDVNFNKNGLSSTQKGPLQAPILAKNNAKLNNKLDTEKVSSIQPVEVIAPDSKWMSFFGNESKILKRVSLLHKQAKACEKTQSTQKEGKPIRTIITTHAPVRIKEKSRNRKNSLRELEKECATGDQLVKIAPHKDQELTNLECSDTDEVVSPKRFIDDLSSISSSDEFWRNRSMEKRTAADNEEDRESSAVKPNCQRGESNPNKVALPLAENTAAIQCGVRLLSDNMAQTIARTLSILNIKPNQTPFAPVGSKERKSILKHATSPSQEHIRSCLFQTSTLEDQGVSTATDSIQREASFSEKNPSTASRKWNIESERIKVSFDGGQSSLSQCEPDVNAQIDKPSKNRSVNPDNYALEDMEISSLDSSEDESEDESEVTDSRDGSSPGIKHSPNSTQDLSTSESDKSADQRPLINILELFSDEAVIPIILSWDANQHGPGLGGNSDDKPKPRPLKIELKENKRSYPDVRTYQKTFTSFLMTEMWEKINAATPVDVDCVCTKSSLSIIKHSFGTNEVQYEMETSGSGCGVELSKGDLLLVDVSDVKRCTQQSAYGLVTGLGHSTTDGGAQTITVAIHKSAVNVPLVTSFKFVTSLQYELNQVKMLISFMANPLAQHITNPVDDSAFITKAFSSSKGKQNLPLKELVRIYKDDAFEVNDSSRRGALRLFDGPVGSGKTRFLASLISEMAQTKKQRLDSKSADKLLVCAPSPKALDVLIKEIWKLQRELTKEQKKLQKGPKNNVGGVEIVRFDPQGEADPQLTYFLLPYLVDQERRNYNDNGSDDEIQTKLLQRADVIGCTLRDCSSQMMKSVLEGNVFAVFVDDAGHCLETELLLALQCGTQRVFLAGDQRQGIVNVRSKQSQDLNFGWSLLARLAKNFEPDDDRIHRWEYQYRMKAALAEFPSAYFYGNGVQTNEKIFPPNWKAFPIRPYVVFDVCDSTESEVDGSFQNKAETDFVSELIKVCESVKPKGTSVGIITPFQEQKKFLQQQLTKLAIKDMKAEYAVGTLDDFYGKEKNVIILCCTKTTTSTTNHGFVTNPRELNLALTRARHSMIVVGNINYLRQVNHCWKELANNAANRKIVFTTARGSFHEDAHKCLCVWSEQNPSLTPESKLLHVRLFRPSERRRSTTVTSPQSIEPTQTDSAKVAWSDAPTAAEKALETKTIVKRRPSAYAVEEGPPGPKKQNPNIHVGHNPAYAGCGESPQEGDTAESHMGVMLPDRGNLPCQATTSQGHLLRSLRSVSPKDHASSGAAQHPFGNMAAGWTDADTVRFLGKPPLRERHNSEDNITQRQGSKHVHFPKVSLQGSRIEQKAAKFLRMQSVPSSAVLARAAEFRRDSAGDQALPLQQGTAMEGDTHPMSSVTPTKDAQRGILKARTKCPSDLKAQSPSDASQTKHTGTKTIFKSQNTQRKLQYAKIDGNLRKQSSPAKRDASRLMSSSEEEEEEEEPAATAKQQQQQKSPILDPLRNSMKTDKEEQSSTKKRRLQAHVSKSCKSVMMDESERPLERFKRKFAREQRDKKKKAKVVAKKLASTFRQRRDQFEQSEEARKAEKESDIALISSVDSHESEKVRSRVRPRKRAYESHHRYRSEERLKVRKKVHKREKGFPVNERRRRTKRVLSSDSDQFEFETPEACKNYLPSAEQSHAEVFENFAMKNGDGDVIKSHSKEHFCESDRRVGVDLPSEHQFDELSDISLADNSDSGRTQSGGQRRKLTTSELYREIRERQQSRKRKLERSQRYALARKSRLLSRHSRSPARRRSESPRVEKREDLSVSQPPSLLSEEVLSKRDYSFIVESLLKDREAALAEGISLRSQRKKSGRSVVGECERSITENSDQQSEEEIDPHSCEITNRDRRPTSKRSDSKTHRPSCGQCGNWYHKTKKCPLPGIVQCKICKQLGHKAKFCPENEDVKNPKPRCFTCNKVGHKSKDCRLGKEIKTICESICPDNEDSTDSDSFRCYMCNQVGHMAKDCPVTEELNKFRECFHCKEVGHSERHCPQKKSNFLEDAKKTLECFNCHKLGHFARNCPQRDLSTEDVKKNREKKVKKLCKKISPVKEDSTISLTCFTCNEVGHIAKDCPVSEELKKSHPCFRCNELGHFGGNCPQKKKPSSENVNKTRECFNCKKPGHIGRECPEIKCYNCNEFGHTAKFCKS